MNASYCIIMIIHLNTWKKIKHIKIRQKDTLRISSKQLVFSSVICSIITSFKPNTHRRRDKTVESRRVGGVYTNSQLVGDSFVVSSVWTHPSAVVTRIVNWPPTAVLCVWIRRQSSRIHVHTADAMRQNSFVSSASAVCIELYQVTC